ncbi:MAG: glycogen debranching enzyme family protein [Candidatus Rokubacteria bacterium]|nr:glycogen debranching enzyme family protein [Candidatus Rokubacteria bacterium]
MNLECGREVTGDLATAERREWLCTNGAGGYASGTVAGDLTRRYHGLLVAALAPPLGHTLVVAKVEETLVYDAALFALGTNRWASGAIEPNGYRHLERFHLDGTTPVWTYACADARLEKRVWMEHGENTTYVRYHLLGASRPVRLTLRVLVNHRDHHGTTRGADWTMETTAIRNGVRVIAVPGATPLLLQATGTGALASEATHSWYHAFALARERERGLDWVDDHLHAATFSATLAPGQTLTLVASTESDPSVKPDVAWARRRAREDERLAAWRTARPWAADAPPWIARLVLAADQFLVRRLLPGEPNGLTVIAGYPWFGDWGRDTMIALPGLTLTTGRPDVAAVILRTFARLVDRGLLPNRLPERDEPREYNTADATLWFIEAIRAYHAATGDDGLLKELLPAVESILDWHRRGTRHGIAVDAADGLLRAGEPGMPLTWMDAKVGDHVVTPRIGKPVEVNALWINALATMIAFAERTGRPAREYQIMADRATKSFGRFWNADRGHCFDVIDGPGGDDDALRPNQIFTVSLPVSPLSAERRRRVVDACARELLTSYGLRTLAPGHPAYRGACAGDVPARDGAYHQGTVWSWLLGPFAIAHHRVHGDRAAARALLAPLAHHLADHGLGSIAEIFDGDPPHAPRGAIAQAWSVAETLRAWEALTG